MTHFFPANSRLDTERAPSLNRRAHSRGTLREASNDTPSDSRQSRPSHINWLQNSLATTPQTGPPTPRRSSSARLGRSASLSALTAPPPALHRQSSLISNHSLQLASSRTGNPAAASAHPVVKQLSPISERSYVPTPKREQYFMDAEPTTPVSIGSSYSAFLRRPLKRSISATSTSSLRTDATPTHPPVLPPLNISPLEIRPVYPPVSHRAGQQLVSTVYEDAGSERTGSFVTARADSDNEEEDAEDTAAAPSGAPGPSNSTTFSSTTQPGSKSDPDRATQGTTTLTATLPSGSGSGDGSSSSAFGNVPPARPRPRRRVPTSGGSGSTTDAFIWRRWTQGLSLGSRLSRPSFSAARRAVTSRLPPLPVLLFWAGFLAPWCWLIGGWLIAEGRWEDNGKARAALPLWKPRPTATATARGAAKAKRTRRGRGGPQVPSDPLAKDLEQGNAAAATAAAAAAVTARDGQTGEEEGRGRIEEGAGDPVGGPRQWWYWVPCAGSGSGHSGAAGVPSAPGLGPSPNVVTLVKPYSAEVWVYRCRLAAVLSSLMLLTALIVALVVIRSSNS